MNQPVVGKEYYARHYITNQTQIKVIMFDGSNVAIKSTKKHDDYTRVISLENFNESYAETFKEIHIPYLKGQIQDKKEYIAIIKKEIKDLEAELKEYG